MIQFNSLPVIPLRITSKFGIRDTGIKGATTNHRGIDLGANKSLSQTPILAVKNGEVIGNYWDDTRGWVVTIQHDGFVTLYQHLKTQSSLKIGSQISSGQIIGTMGNSSKTLTIAVHLHFELWINGLPVDPEYYLNNIAGEDDEEMEIYEHIDELTGDWKEAVLWALDKGIIKGNGKTMGLRESEVKAIVFLYRDNQRKKTQ